MEHNVDSSLSNARMTPWLERAWLIRYLDRELSDEETSRFEAYALDKPDLLDMIESDNRLRDSLRAEPNTIAGYATDGREHGRDTAAHETHRKSRSPRMWLPIAASLVLGAGTGIISSHWLWGVPGSSGPIPSPMHMVYDTMRGTDSPNIHVEHKDSASPYVIVEVAVPPDAKNISMKLGDAPEQSLTPSADGFVSFLVQRNQLTHPQQLTLHFLSAGTVRSHELTINL